LTETVQKNSPKAKRTLQIRNQKTSKRGELPILQFYQKKKAKLHTPINIKAALFIPAILTPDSGAS